MTLEDAEYDDLLERIADTDTVECVGPLARLCTVTSTYHRTPWSLLSEIIKHKIIRVCPRLSFYRELCSSRAEYRCLRRRNQRV
jgi:hypothetical protein